ncbi:band 7 protein AGAP004871 [Scaptodrosophila lebanonensis]|uniref:Band 7 protein AGAP004871 n=1 Tax=Drosophila lebanonensis TaxID=7225 RepID=A0A6J2TXA0_DROLE|nr:band 7 protein AGAP004871 [Scaptodrosophila lebanonensis]
MNRDTQQYANYEDLRQSEVPAGSNSIPYMINIPNAEQQPRPTQQGFKTSENEPAGCFELVAIILSVVAFILTFPVAIFICFKVVAEYERAIIFRMGRLRSGGARGPGVFFVLPCIDEYCKVDLRTVTFNVPQQEMLTKDSVTVTVDAVVYYRINEPLSAVIQVADYSTSTRLLAATTLRNIVGTRNLSELLTERETLAHNMQGTLDVATEPWGVMVERVEIKDVSLPHSMQRAMAAEAEAARDARAKVIAAEGEKKSAAALKEASDVISSSPSALQLRYLQTLSSISAEKNSTIIFPLPMELLTPYLAKYADMMPPQKQ